MIAALHRPEPGASGHRARPEGLALERLWSGYGAALGGVRKAGAGLREVMRLHRGATLAKKEALAAYRAFVHEAAEERASGANGLTGRKRHEASLA